jgi:hypothetical protein
LLALLPGPRPASAADPLLNGTFEFLTQALPVGTTNAEYVARILIVNADGPVTFSVDELAPGMALDPVSGFITGRPTSTFNKNITLTADDTTQAIQLLVELKINAAGGGGNEGSTFGTTSLATGRVGTPYFQALNVVNGVGPYIYGATDLPPGLTLDGLTGEISGNPIAAGTYFTSLSVTDFGENENKAVTVLPLTVLPQDSDFLFSTLALNNGEIGTPFCDTWLTTGETGAVTFGSSGLPAGLVLDPATGIVTGMPTEAGTFRVIISANDGSATIASNHSMVIVPSAASSFYWDFFGLPAALINVAYDRQPPILLATQNGVAVEYTAVGLPPGIAYNVNSGELSGTATQVGEFPVVFTANDTNTGEVLTLETDFVVLPPEGGDPNRIPVNFWVTKSKLRSGDPGSDSWAGAAFYNDDRRTGNAFDPATDALTLQIGASVVQIDPGLLEGTSKAYKYKTPKGVAPVYSVAISPTKQALKWSTKSDTITEGVPGVFRQTLVLGSKTYRLLEQFDEKGGFKAPTGYRRPAFVLVKGAMTAGVAGDDSAKLALLLADPALVYDPGVSTLKVRILDGATVLLDRDFTALGAAKITFDNNTGATIYAIKTLKDELAVVDQVKKFSYSSKTGKMQLALDLLDLTAVPALEAHLTFEITIGSRVYRTSVTFFEKKPGKLSTAMP